MPKLDRYLLSEFAQATFATLVVLMIVTVGGAFTDVLQDIARGRVPAGMMLAQLGLVVLKWLPLILPLALMLGLMLAVGRLYRDSEMPVIASIGVGPRRLLRPLLLLAAPLVAVVAACSLWLGPWADRLSKQMINEAGRNLAVAGLEPGAFTGIPNGGGVIYVGSMSGDGSRFERVFIYRDLGEGRIDVTTSARGEVTVDQAGSRYLTLHDGFQVEGPRVGDRDFRMLHYARNQLLLPASEQRYDPDAPDMQPTLKLLGDGRREATAQLHYRLAPPLLTLAFALMAVPLARSMPRQSRYGRVVMGFLAYLIGLNLMMAGRGWLASGKIAPALGLWWLVLPALAIGAWLYFRDGRLGRPKRIAAAETAR
ncbi:LPS export ABC transporter permease LptF [Vulcaniibacterium tengchongense]|uniref:Lipopolysaccharide export system permease protein LptF n=1 Tax=Vulcaniibacterium tengchongense TaxID=1273429 RepID=A0A3N4W0G4_9GAMM|nr:LPS export ABC transporter permease LptF [Vulcaniibacterium tengchongense]RPE79570.1 lipopolysaccharide export system permease protein [Vulcaniibacterium tengchongense]